MRPVSSYGLHIHVVETRGKYKWQAVKKKLREVNETKAGAKNNGWKGN